MSVFAFIQFLQFRRAEALNTGILALLLFYDINKSFKFYFTTDFLNKKEKNKCFLYSYFISLIFYTFFPDPN